MRQVMTLDEALPRAVRRLADAGIESAGFEMQLLLAQALGVSRVSVLAHTYPPPTVDKIERFVALVELRAQRVPMAYLRGDQEFYGLPFRVTGAVLIPRPETEMLVDLAIRQFAVWQTEHRSRWGVLPGAEEAFTFADVGTGSGCIAIAILATCPQMRAAAYDLSSDALAVAGQNAVGNGVADRLRRIRGDLLTSAAPGAYDLIVSNPPYIPTVELETLQPEVRDYEPRLALDGGSAGMDCYLRIAADAGLALKPKGQLLLEVGCGQAQAVADLLQAAGYDELRIWPDLAGIERVVGCRRAGA